jgi:hypothetical protein
MNSILWYLRGIADIRSFADVVAMPKIFMWDLQCAIARFLLDKTEIGDAVVAEHTLRKHLQRAKELGASIYCVYHACDANNCPNDGAHRE